MLVWLFIDSVAHKISIHSLKNTYLYWQQAYVCLLLYLPGVSLHQTLNLFLNLYVSSAKSNAWGSMDAQYISVQWLKSRRANHTGSRAVFWPCELVSYNSLCSVTRALVDANTNTLVIMWLSLFPHLLTLTLTWCLDLFFHSGNMIKG